MKVLKEPKTGLYVREGTLDEYVVKEQTCYSKIFEKCEGKTVLDIGGNIGAFAYNARKNGAKIVHSFEPDPENIKMFKKQRLNNVKLHEYAVAREDGIATFYQNTGKNKGLHSLRETRGRDTIEVKTIAFEKILKRVKPDIIKIDIEGGEYYIDLDLILKTNAKYIAIEIHLTQPENYEQGIEYIKWLQKNFIELSTHIDTTEKITSWTKLFIGRRKTK